MFLWYMSSFIHGIHIVSGFLHMTCKREMQYFLLLIIVAALFLIYSRSSIKTEEWVHYV